MDDFKPIKHFIPSDLQERVEEAFAQAIIDCGEMVPAGVGKGALVAYDLLFEGIVDQVITWIWEADIGTTCEVDRGELVNYIGERKAKIGERKAKKAE
jgi:hypothetical protein